MSRDHSPIAEGGAAGHLSHPHEDLDLTLGDIADTLKRVSSGDAGPVAEKLDGMNVMFTADTSGRVVLARNLGDIRSGGVSGDDILSRYESRGRSSVGGALSSAAGEIESALAPLSRAQLLRVFDSGRVWLSAEVIDPRWTNVIEYDSAAAAVHATPVIVAQRTGEIEKLSSHPSAKLLTKLAPALAPASSFDATQLVSSASKRAAADAARALMRIGRSDDTLASVVKRYVSAEYDDACAARAAGEITRAQLTSAVGRAPSDVELRGARVRALAPVESAVRAFAVEALRSAKSALVRDRAAHSRALASKLSAAISTIEKLGDSSAAASLARELERLPVGEITQALEGVVISRGGRAYKLTGAFAPINKIIGLARQLEQAQDISESAAARALIEAEFRRRVLLLGV